MFTTEPLSQLWFYNFVPTCYIQEGIVHKLDAFYKPLIDDAKKYYIQGIGDDFIEKGIHTAQSSFVVM